MKNLINLLIIALIFWTIFTIDGADINHLSLEFLGFVVLGFFRVYHKDLYDFLTKPQ